MSSEVLNILDLPKYSNVTHYPDQFLGDLQLKMLQGNFMMEKFDERICEYNDVFRVFF